MRKYIKKQLISTLEELRRVNEDLGKKIGYTGERIITEVLTECQQYAIQIGNTIEASEGEGTVTVKLLEDYCELIYQLGESLQNIRKAGLLIKSIENLLVQIKNSILQDLTESKKEVVFLPYKASMWDSLESIWTAAKEDKSCNVSVISIPYYDKNQDGTLAQMHYEGEEYPEYVPITSWQEYNLSEIHPDVIYIHNPYDGYNYATSIHPDFYSRNLKKYTDMLVYIPYFVNLEDVPRHLCLTSGVLNADKVIIESEKIRQTYIEEFQKFEVENNCAGMFGKAEEKFIALGSPKFDKVMNTKLDDVIIPGEWKRLIIKDDGSRKKVILYNITVETLLKLKDKMLDKIEAVLDTFRKSQDVVLLWRPHPLINAALSSMRADLSKRYDSIVRRYCSESWGIYDDTADLHRAIALSDAYYGDWSSVVALYMKTNKPIMIQDAEVKNEEEITDDLIKFNV